MALCGRNFQIGTDMMFDNACAFGRGLKSPAGIRTLPSLPRRSSLLIPRRLLESPPSRPAALGICEYTSDEDADSLWSLRVFNDFDTGFKVSLPLATP